MTSQQADPCGCENTHALDNAADDWFDPYQYRLYGRYCRVCGDSDDGVCREGTRELAKQCQMSVGKVSSVRAWLKEQGYIAYKEGRGDQPYETSLLERSPHEHLSDTVQDMNESVSPHEQQGVHHTNDTVHEGESVHPMNTHADEIASHTSARAAKQILKSLNTQEQEQGLKDKNDSHTLSTAPARPRFTTALYGGQDVYADGRFISPENEFGEFLVACNAIFDAWLGALKTLRRAPMLSDETLWEQNREAAVSLAKFRANPADVKDFVLAQYKAKDPFWRNLKSPMKLSAVANGLSSWMVNPVEETVATSANGKHAARAAPAAPAIAATSLGAPRNLGGSKRVP